VKNNLILLIHLLVYGLAIAQKKPLPPPQPENTPPPPGLPIDNGIAILLILGIVLGLYLIFSKNNKKLKSR